MQKRIPTYPAGFTLIELILVIIVLGALSAIAVPRLPDTGLFEDTYDARQVASSLNRARAHALASQCHVLIELQNNELQARIANNCKTEMGDPHDRLRDFSDNASNLDFILEGFPEKTGITGTHRIVFTPEGAAKKLDHNNISSVNLVPGQDLLPFSSGTLELTHQNDRTIQIDDTTGYVR